MKVCFKQCVVAFGVLCINAPFMHGVIVELRRCVRLAQFSCDFTITSAIVITYFSTPCRTWTYSVSVKVNNNCVHIMTDILELAAAILKMHRPSYSFHFAFSKYMDSLFKNYV